MALRRRLFERAGDGEVVDGAALEHKWTLFLELMVKLTAVIVVIASFLFFAPVIESGTPSHLSVFQAVGNAAEGAGD